MKTSNEVIDEAVKDYFNEVEDYEQGERSICIYTTTEEIATFIKTNLKNWSK